MRNALLWIVALTMLCGLRALPARQPGGPTAPAAPAAPAAGGHAEVHKQVGEVTSVRITSSVAVGRPAPAPAPAPHAPRAGPRAPAAPPATEVTDTTSDADRKAPLEGANVEFLKQLQARKQIRDKEYESVTSNVDVSTGGSEDSAVEESVKSEQTVPLDDDEAFEAPQARAAPRAHRAGAGRDLRGDAYAPPAPKYYSEPPKVYSQPAQVYSEPAKFYSEPAKVYGEPAKVYSEPAKVYSEPAKVYGEPAKFYSEPASLRLDEWPRTTTTEHYHQPEKNYEVDEKVSVSTDGRSHGVQEDCRQDKCKVGYVVEGRRYRKYRVEERTPDGFIVGEYGVVRHADGALRGVRYTAAGDASPRLIYDALMKFLQLKR